MILCVRKRKNNYLCTQLGRADDHGTVCSDTDGTDCSASMVPITVLHLVPIQRYQQYIHDSLDLPLNELIETANNCIKEKAAKIIFIDCLQMIDFDKDVENASERVSKVMHSLKQLAYQADIPIVIGSMLGRGVEIREGLEGRQPYLSDLANSSYIEEIADVILMVHRPEYYCIYQDDAGRDLHGVMMILVKKNSLNLLGGIYLKYQQDTGIIFQEGNANSVALKLVSLKEIGVDNKTIKKLTDAFDLEELPF